MNDDERVPELRPFVMSLLVVATGDSWTIPEAVNIVHNAAFRYGLELSGSFPDLAQPAIHGDCSLGGLLEKDAGAHGFFIFCGRLLDALDQRIRGRHRVFRRSPSDEPSSYDHAAFLALGQTLCKTADVQRAKFPPIDECFARIARALPRELQKAFVKNYLGNVLHDYFDASQVRAEFPSLEVDTEGTLRTEEAAAISETVFAQVGGDKEPVDTPAIQRELQAVIARVWLAEKDLDD